LLHVVGDKGNVVRVADERAPRVEAEPEPPAERARYPEASGGADSGS
jgi:hypothetical protein